MRIAAVPPIRYLRTDSTGTAIVGLPPLRITQECASCHAWLDSSLYRPLARACRPCEAAEVAGRIQPTASRQAGGGPADTNRSRAVQKPSSGRPIACDVLVANFHPVGSDGRSRPLWLNRGALHRQAASALAGDWYECRDLNPGSGVGNAR